MQQSPTKNMTDMQNKGDTHYGGLVNLNNLGGGSNEPSFGGFGGF